MSGRSSRKAGTWRRFEKGFWRRGRKLRINDGRNALRLPSLLCDHFVRRRRHDGRPGHKKVLGSRQGRQSLWSGTRVRTLRLAPNLDSAKGLDSDRRGYRIEHQNKPIRSSGCKRSGDAKPKFFADWPLQRLNSVAPSTRIETFGWTDYTQFAHIHKDFARLIEIDKHLKRIEKTWTKLR